MGASQGGRSIGAGPQIFSGNEASKTGVQQLRRLGLGRLSVLVEHVREGGRVVPKPHFQRPLPGIPQMYDCGAYGAWTHGLPFPGAQFLQALARCFAHHGGERFKLVAPDIVAGGASSLAFSSRWARVIGEIGNVLGAPAPFLYLAVQDGMRVDEVAPLVRGEQFQGIFIGGSPAWKWGEGVREWIPAARGWGVPVHLARVGTLESLLRARALGVDSVDSSSWAHNGTYGIIEAARAQECLTAFLRPESER